MSKTTTIIFALFVFVLFDIAFLFFLFGNQDVNVSDETEQNEVEINETTSQVPITIEVNDDSEEFLYLGDGKVTSAPESGSVFACQLNFNPNAPGTITEGPWIEGDIWYPDQKVMVDGAVEWPNASLDISIDGDNRIIIANNLPLHTSGTFPISPSDDAYAYDRNPNPIQEQDIDLVLPRIPEIASSSSCVNMGLIGFANTGVAIYNALDARGRDAAAHEILDLCAAHPQQQGQYHYHDHSSCLADQPTGKHSEILGYALDGFGIFGQYDENGGKMTNDDLDECHGHEHDVEWDGEFINLYHYHMTEEYPYSVGCFKGTPIQ